MRLNRKKISRDIIAIILLVATITPAAFHTVRGQSLTTSFTYTPTQPARTETINFNATASGGTAPYAFTWDFGDGSSASGSSISHSYPTSGTYATTVTVTDSSLQQAFQAQQVTVTNYHAFSFAIAGDIGNINAHYSNTNTYAPHQSLLRLGNTTGLSFFIANGWLADGLYYRNEAAWCNTFKTHYNNLILVAGETDTGWTDVPFDDIVYDSNNNGIYDNAGSGPDSILFNGWGGGSHAPGPVNGSPIASDNQLRYWDINRNGQWDPGESIVYAYDGATTPMQAHYPVMVGLIPPTGTTLSFDAKIKYFQRDTNPFYVRPQSNNDFEQYVANCGFPSSLGAWHGSGLNCSNTLPGQPGYTFPSCYGREYYFDYGYPTPELRVIVISPSVQNVTGHMTSYGTDYWLYQKDDAHYNWVNTTIQAAYAAGIPETMVVSFEGCLYTGVEECAGGYHHQSPYDSSGTKFEGDLFSMLLDNLGPLGKRPTYLIQGDEKVYSRYYPIATHPNPPFASDGLGCLWDSPIGAHGFPLTKYSYDTPADVMAEYSPPCFANPLNPGQPYAPWPGLAGKGVPIIVSSAFGAQLYATLNPGEVLVKDTNGDGVYDYGEPYIGGLEPVPGTVLTGGQATNSHIAFIDSDGNGQWEPGETLFKDADSNDGCSTTTACNGKYDPGETVFSGPVPNTQMNAAFNDSDVKLIDTNGNGKWDRIGGSPHNALEAPYLATSMGRNTPCNNTAYSTTCPGHGWVSFTFNAAGNQTGIDTNFCIDGERPLSSYASCISPHVYNDKYLVVNSAQSVQQGLFVSASFDGVSATMAAYRSGTTMLTAWITATNTSTAQVFISHSATYINFNPSKGTQFIYQINTTSSNALHPWLGFACTFTPGGLNNSCIFSRTPDINHDDQVNIVDLATAAYSFGTRPSDPNWNPNCDLNNDGIVNILDLAYAAFYFGSPAFAA